MNNPSMEDAKTINGEQLDSSSFRYCIKHNNQSFESTPTAQR